MCFFSLIMGASVICYANSGITQGSENNAFLKQTDVFVAGADGVDTYRIPALLITQKDTLLAFCEARKESIRDASPTDMVLKRSTDNGKTWSPMQVIIRGTSEDAIMNPCPVVDRSNGTIFLVCSNVQQAKLLVTKSTDDGVTWSDPVDISETARCVERFAPGPGIGIQMKKARLVIPGYSARGCSMVIYSDDHGETWHAGGEMMEDGPGSTGESQVVQLMDGSLMLNMRSFRGKSCRAVATSADGGETWNNLFHDEELNECPCQASFIRYTDEERHDRNRLLFANPNVSGAQFEDVPRTNMTVRLSYDEGETWPVARELHAGPSSYSGLVVLPDMSIGCLYEGGEKHRREWLRLARFNLEWLTDGKDSVKKAKK
jgi:sialidase-1